MIRRENKQFSESWVYKPVSRYTLATDLLFNHAALAVEHKIQEGGMSDGDPRTALLEPDAAAFRHSRKSVSTHYVNE